MKKILSICTFLMLSSNALAEQIWSDFSISLLKGDNYQVGSAERNYVTLEHASGHSWGDMFIFVDRGSHKDPGVRSDTYGEISSRLSLSNLSGTELSFGPITDVYLAGLYEYSSEGNYSFDNYLVGLGIDLAVPNFNYVQIAYYKAYNDHPRYNAQGNTISNNDYQLSVNFNYPISKNILLDGFANWTPSKNGARAETNFTSQLKYNVGSIFGAKQPVYIGVEHSHWNNKFSTDQDQRDTSLLLKWHF